MKKYLIPGFITVIILLIIVITIAARPAKAPAPQDVTVTTQTSPLATTTGSTISASQPSTGKTTVPERQPGKAAPSFAIYSINAAPSYKAVSPIAITVDAREISGIAAAPSDGFSLTVVFKDQNSTTLSSSNVSYNSQTHLWQVYNQTPAIPGTYSFEATIYCASSDASTSCVKNFGTGARRSKTVTFIVTQ